MHAVLGHDDMVLLALSYCSPGTLGSACWVSHQELVNVLWVVLCKGRTGACIRLALDLGFIQQLMPGALLILPPTQVSFPAVLTPGPVLCLPVLPAVGHDAVDVRSIYTSTLPSQCGRGHRRCCTPSHATPRFGCSRCQQVLLWMPVSAPLLAPVGIQLSGRHCDALAWCVCCFLAL
eukprot:gene3739-biopygen3680